ncbi:hypothetical protein SAICODRAFT_29272, partial [Saitoella complicata NRRL Y-17804]|uniref:uncharacterized protein n=1 Tax=Saitoella complicata (strain BCRC 22490 / CBS 7301 / JCM 7358 / NBRC 10748 / NRRL Y-17804) TaxID=698492 RepID=UPI000867A63A
MPDLNIEDIPYSDLLHEERPYRCAEIVGLTKAEIPKEKIEEQRLVKRRTLEGITNNWWKTASYRYSPCSGVLGSFPNAIRTSSPAVFAQGSTTTLWKLLLPSIMVAKGIFQRRRYACYYSKAKQSVLHSRGNRFCRLRLGKGITNGQRSTCTGGRRTGCGSSTPTNRNSRVLGQDMLQRSMSGLGILL